MASTKIIQKNKSHILYDASIISKPGEHLFDPEWLSQQADVNQVGHDDGNTSVAKGRGAAWFVKYENMNWVLRHYKRGGLISRWNKDLYLGLSLSASRGWKEWYLLNSMYSLGLSVPQPVAASVSWPFGRILGLYRAAIIVMRIPEALTLAEKCQQQTVDLETWKKLGLCIKKFHNHGFYHADLNANNILFDQNDKVYLIDFDKGEVKSDGKWKLENLHRLKRSLLKLQGLHESLKFSEQDWEVLLEAYKA